MRQNLLPSGSGNATIRATMKNTTWLNNIVLSFVIFTSSLFQFSSPVFAEPQQPTLTLDAVGQAVAVVPVNDPNLKTPDATELAFPDATTTEFLSNENPLSHVKSEDVSKDGLVSIESDDPFYSTSGSWGQSYDDLWWLKQVHAEQAWSYTKGAGVTVAVIDTGLDYNHPDIAANLWTKDKELNGLPGVDDDGNGYADDVHGWDFYNWDNDPLDDNGHGTHVAGIIAGVANNQIGIAGIAPEAKILPIKVLDSNGSGYVTDVVAAIRYAVNLGAKVINLSLGVFKNFLSRSLQTSFQSAINYATTKGAIVVAAAGNENSSVNNVYPAALTNVISVGATDSTKTRAYFSNYGTLLDFVAPGVDILSLKAAGVSFGSDSVLDPNYVRATGTSMASPMVAGIVALLKAYFPKFSFTQIYDRLKKSVTDLGTKGFDKYYGWGLVDALKAFTLGVTPSTSVLTSSVSVNPGVSLLSPIGSAASTFMVSVENFDAVQSLVPAVSSAQVTTPQAPGYYDVWERLKDNQDDAKNPRIKHRAKKKLVLHHLKSAKP